MWSRSWIKRGLFFALIPLGALSCSHRWHGHRDLSVAELQERLADGTDDVMDFVDASDDQTRRVKDVVSAAATDLAALREEHKTLRSEFQQLLAAPDVNRDELEGLRVNALDLADRASARLLTAVADVADILTVAQRRKLIRRWQKHQG
jgi:chemotaxis regulatin CheY-phosphate phosphatase CheZ